MRFARRYGLDPEIITSIGGPDVWAHLEEAGNGLDGPSCPFCGAAPEIVLGCQINRPTARIRCAACGCSTPIVPTGLVPSWTAQGQLVYEPLSIIGALYVAMKKWMRRQDAIPHRLRA